MILVVGHTAYDHISKVPHFPDENSSIFIEDYKKLRGGGAANVASAIANLGGKASLHSAVGEDFKNSSYEKNLKKIGVDTQTMIYTEEKTANAFIYTNNEEDQITFFYWGASEVFSELDAPKNLEKYEIIHLAPSDPEYNIKMAKKDKKISFDPGQDLPVYSSKQLKKVIKNSDFLFCNEYELEKIKSKTDKGLDELNEILEILVVTHHENGSTVYYGNKKHEIPAIETVSKDPTGAGDAYRAGFLTAYLDNKSIKRCGEIASTVASFVVEEIGCQTNLPTKKQVKKRYENNFDKKF